MKCTTFRNGTQYILKMHIYEHLQGPSCFFIRSHLSQIRLATSVVLFAGASKCMDTWTKFCPRSFWSPYPAVVHHLALLQRSCFVDQFFFSPRLFDRCTLSSIPPHPFRIGVGAGLAPWGQPAGALRSTAGHLPPMPGWGCATHCRAEWKRLRSAARSSAMPTTCAPSRPG